MEIWSSAVTEAGAMNLLERAAREVAAATRDEDLGQVDAGEDDGCRWITCKCALWDPS